MAHRWPMTMGHFVLGHVWATFRKIPIETTEIKIDTTQIIETTQLHIDTTEIIETTQLQIYAAEIIETTQLQIYTT